MNVATDLSTGVEPRTDGERHKVAVNTRAREGQRCWLGPLLCWVYGFVRPQIAMRAVIRWLAEHFEGGQFYSLTLRDIMRKYHGVEIGLYTNAAPFVPWAFRPGTKIGRFCSIYWTVQAFRMNHPRNLKSTHPFFYGPPHGFARKDVISRTSLVIGNDVWIGHNAIILPSVKEIGDGAVIGAGAVVYQDVPPYAIAMGNPARVVSYRFKKAIIEDLLAERWWDKPLAEIMQNVEDFRHTLDGGPIQ